MDLRRADNEWRLDPVDEAWTIVAKNRRVLPARVQSPATAIVREARGRSCPFCANAPPNLVASLVSSAKMEKDREEDGERVAEMACVVSPTPLLFTEHGLPPLGGGGGDSPESYSSAGALGVHELLVPLGATNCALAPSAWGVKKQAALFALIAKRYEDLGRDQRLQTMTLSALPPSHTRLPHAHATMLAMPHAAEHLPPGSAPRGAQILADLENAKAHGRVLASGDEIAVWVPYAPRSTLHLRLASTNGALDLVLKDESRRHAFAALLHQALVAIDAVLEQPARAAWSLRALPLRPSAADASETLLVAELEAIDDADVSLGHSLGARVASVAPEEIAALLQPYF